MCDEECDDKAFAEPFSCSDVVDSTVGRLSLETEDEGTRFTKSGIWLPCSGCEGTKGLVTTLRCSHQSTSNGLYIDPTSNQA